VRRVWVQVHLWLGLTLGVLGVFIGITGAILVYDHEIDAWLNPQRYATTGPQVALRYDDYIGRIPQGRVINLRLPEFEGGPIVALARGRDGGQFHRVWIDPPTGRVLDAAPGGGFVGWVHRFHENLTLREYRGREVVGLVGIAMLVSSLTGLYLWWPARGRFRQALGMRQGIAASRNIHYLSGFYGALVLALLSFTGIWLAYPDAARNLLGAAPRAIQAPEPAGGQEPVGPDAAVNAARALYPNARVTGLSVPAGPRGVYRVNLRSGEDAVAVFLDPASGSVLRRYDPATQGAGDRFLAAIRLLHTGDGFGLGRMILFLAGLLPAILAVSGALIWLRARRAERFR
jgi:uncharacterized iron-regulated membrane protein